MAGVPRHARLATLLLLSAITVALTTCAAREGPRLIDAARDGAAAESDWSRVRQLAPAAPVQLTIHRSPATARYIVAADDQRLVVMNLELPGLTPGAQRALRRLLSRHADDLAAVSGRAFVEGDVQIGSRGVFAGTRKVAEFDDLIQQVPRPDVALITGPVVARGSVPGVLLGGWAGFAIGVLPALGGAADGAAWVALGGSIAAGATLGHRWSSHTTTGVIYRAP